MSNFDFKKWAGRQVPCQPAPLFGRICNNHKHVIDISCNKNKYPYRLKRWRSGLERWPHKRKVGCSNPSRKKVVKIGNDSSTAKRSAISVSVTGPWS